ncbi:MAG: IFN-inducible and antiviral [Lasallia pustulata]|uniref:IFN-inducible and antiviral n=1 Tax=Lasallia pustulata TaxID=136370 RepID=A0A5M8PSX7_9LECA|nr:MAG: IFN-inducible and antiviral [Lasallia pustulata]
MALLKAAGMRKNNFAGGEPFMKPGFLGQLAKYCKETVHLESVSIVTNGSKVTADWLAEYGQYIDIMAVSCDSFDETTNVKIGRGTGSHLKKFQQLCRTCKEYGVMFKVNTVVNRYNFQEDMNSAIQEIGPVRWKCFQVLIVPEENGSKEALRDATKFVISDDKWKLFCDKHKHQKCFVPEGNDVMASSYLLLDEYLQFLNKGVKDPTKSILEIGVEKAMKDVYWDERAFNERGGVYQWSKRGHDAHSELDF